MSDLDQERETADKMIAMAGGDEDFDGEVEDEGGGGKRLLIMIGTVAVDHWRRCRSPFFGTRRPVTGHAGRRGTSGGRGCRA